MSRIYKNSTQVADLHGEPLYMHDVVDACLAARLNLFLQGDTGAGKTQLAKDAMSYFPDHSLFVLGRNDMDTRELFQQINLGKLHQKPAYNLEPIVNPDSGKVEWYYPKFDEKGVMAYQRLTDAQAQTVRKGLESIAGSTDNIRELTSKVGANLIIVDELPNCVPAVRAQLFNLFDGFIEIAGKAYPIGKNLVATYQDGKRAILPFGIDSGTVDRLRTEGATISSDVYSVGIATGNLGQQFTESANDLGRAIKDRMHVTVDVDHYFPTPSDTMNILAGNTNPRVEFGELSAETGHALRERNTRISSQAVPFAKLVVANYLLHGLDYCNNGASKRKMKEAWPNNVQNNQKGSDEALVLPISPRAAKSIIRLSQSLDDIALQRGATPDEIAQGALNSMMQSYKLVSTHSGVLNEAMVRNVYEGDRHAAMNALIATTQHQFAQKEGEIMAGIEMVRKGKREAKVMNSFTGRWEFMRDTLDALAKGEK